jgi:hypothetical protein
MNNTECEADEYDKKNRPVYSDMVLASQRGTT